MFSINIKHIFVITILIYMVSCGAKQNNVITNTSDTTQQVDNKVENLEYSIKYNNQNEFLSYGSVLGKPFDTIMFADSLWFLCNNQNIYTENSEDGYLFYKNNKHWPKQIITTAGETVILVERSLGEPEGSDIVGFIFKDKKYIKKTVMNQYKWWHIEGDKDYSIKELQDIVKNNPL